VERIARKYLRHPAVIKIGDEESGKNKRIEQRVHFITEGQKKTRVIEEIRRLSSADKAIVFVNSKKQGDVVGRSIEAAGYRAGVLHGGKSQDQREDTLDYFRNGSYQVLVATDVAGRGLDIPDVSYVINFDCPSKIESYCHRIGRTGRAGKSGIATTFLTDSDTDIMYDLRQYLEATIGSASIPLQLKQHPAAQSASGTRDEKGNLLGQKRDAIKFSKR
jgi:ATP-dependent RNA helicase DDX23/PRP28